MMKFIAERFLKFLSFSFAAVLLASGLAACELAGGVKVASLTLPEGKLEAGEPLEVKAEVVNAGLLSVDFDCVLLVDGEEAGAQSAKLEPNKPETLVFGVSGLEAGEHTVDFGGVKQTFTVYKPAAFEVSGLTTGPELVKAGDTVRARATVRNTGELPGGYAGQWTLDGAAAGACEATLQPGGESVLEAEFTVPRGRHTIGLEGMSAVVSAAAPADIRVSGIEFSKPFVKPKEQFTATVSLTNNGDEPGSYAVELFINDKLFQTMEVSVEAGGVAEAAFRVSHAKTGRYTFQAGEARKSIRVATIGRPVNGTLLIKKASSGYGRLTLVNGYKDKDLLFVLSSASNPKAQLLTVFVRRGNKASGIKVKDGVYNVYYTTGGSFDMVSGRFLYDAVYGRFQDPISYKTTRKGYTTYFSIWTITLGVANGNTPSKSVDESEFPQ